MRKQERKSILLLGTDIWKRLFDLVLSLFGVIVLSPLLAFMMLMVWLEGGRPVIFKQKRALSLGGNEFWILKLRTMARQNVKDESLPVPNDGLDTPGDGQNDPNITKIGTFLRRYRLDELPQLINVLRGEMSLVGPRPLSLHDLRCIHAYAHLRERVKRRSDALPGITGIWQVYRRKDTGFEEMILMDEYYIKNRSLILDLLLLLKTIPVVFLRRKEAKVGEFQSGWNTLSSKL